MTGRYLSLMKMVSIRKDLEMHKETQFLNNYSCETYIALPLLKNERVGENRNIKINVKRF